ncbi:glycoside hydrolase superfamily [Peziza echinospora]|nr:glycoside hydrolase superfamily [Peziza echinospora]
MSFLQLGFLVLFLPLLGHAWLPTVDKIRGVNLGSLFISEPWMMDKEWARMGCKGTLSEFDCVLSLGQQKANVAFQLHYDTFYTRKDLSEIKSLGLNTIRIPVGYWMLEDIVYKDSEHFPQGGFKYLGRICQWAREEGLYVIIVLHGAPGAQVAEQPFTGQFAPKAGFYVDYQYERAYKFLEWMTRNIHTNSTAFGTVGALMVLNEPVAGDARVIQSLVNEYYPTAWKRIRAVEGELRIPQEKRLHIQTMSEKWGAGDARPMLSTIPGVNLTLALYDDHHYIKYLPNQIHARKDYLLNACTTDRGSSLPVLAGEWSLSSEKEDEPEFTIEDAENKEWYRKFWIAQTGAYEKQMGWVFWSWRTQEIRGRVDWRWSYRDAVRIRTFTWPCRGTFKNVPSVS